VLRPEAERFLQRDRGDEHGRAAGEHDQPRRQPPEAALLLAVARAEQEVGDDREEDDQEPDHVRHDRVAVLAQELPAVALQAEDEDEHQADHDRRHREREVDERGQDRSARELEARDAPGRGEAKHHVQHQREGHHGEGELDRVEGVLVLDQVLPVDAGAVRQRLGEDVHQRDDDEEADQDDGAGDERAPHPWRVLAGEPHLHPQRLFRFSRHGGASSSRGG
jgi:hypothetical protein